MKVILIRHGKVNFRWNTWYTSDQFDEACMQYDKTSSVSVAIKDIPEKDWKTEVWDKSIVPNEKYLYKRPGYSCEGDM